MKTLLFCLVLVGSFANAQTGTSTTTGVQPSSPSLLKNIVLGMKSYNTSARTADTANAAAKQFKSKNEVRLGYKDKSGWGAYALAVQTRDEYYNSSKNKWEQKDPSVTITHPALFSNENVKVDGYLRAYSPAEQKSRDNGTHQYRYNSAISYKMAGGAEVVNELTPRWFVQSKYKDDQATFYVENRTTYREPINSWSRWGIDHYVQYEQHSKVSPGFVAEVIPQVDFMLNSKVYISPRVALPIFAKGLVGDGPKAAILEQAYAEIYFQAFL